MSLSKYDPITKKLDLIAGGMRTWIGTSDALETALENDEILPGTIIYTTDEYTVSGFVINVDSTLPASGWTNTAPYQQTINIEKMLSSDKPFVDIIISDDISTGITQNTEWKYITKITASDNLLTFFCYENRPSVDLKVNIRVVR